MNTKVIREAMSVELSIEPEQTLIDHWQPAIQATDIQSEGKTCKMDPEVAEIEANLYGHIKANWE